MLKLEPKSDRIQSVPHYAKGNLAQPLTVTELRPDSGCDAGSGWTQCWGEPKQEIRAGDIWCPPGHKHWHGATPNTAMTHIAIQEHLGGGKFVEWLGQIREEQYLPDGCRALPSLPK